MSLSPRRISMAATVALHAAVIGALMQLDAVRQPLAQAIPILVRLITPPKPEPPRPKMEPPKPLPMARRSQAVPKPQPPEPPSLVISESPPPATGWVAPVPRTEPAPVAAAPAPSAPLAPPRILPPSLDAAYLQNPPPAYPLMSKRRGEQGTVVLRVLVDAEGGAERVQVRTSSGHERLDQAAHDAVHRWRFVPARQGERAVAAWVLVPITFAMER
jgi:protein TonB